MAKFRVEFREAATFTEMGGSFDLFDGSTNQVIASTPRELVRMVAKIED